MSRLIGAGAFSLLVHGGLVLAMLALPRWSSVVPPRVLYVVLPALEADEPHHGGGAVGAEGRPRAAETERSADPVERTRSAPALRTGGRPGPRRAEQRDTLTAVEPATPAVEVPPSSSALPAPARAEKGPAVKPSDAVEAGREPQLERRVSERQRPATPLAPEDEREVRHVQEPRAAEPAPRPVARPTAFETIAATMPTLLAERGSSIAEGSPKVPRSASASPGVGGVNAVGRHAVDADDTSTDGRSGRAPLDAGTSTGPRGRAPGREQTGAGGVMAALPGSGEGVERHATPRYSDNPRPTYPWRARVRGEEGVVLLSVLVNEQGGVSEVRVIASSGSSSLDEAATSAVKAWRFQPGRRGTQAVASRVQVPIRFRLED